MAKFPTDRAAPFPGLVIRYSFLWRAEAARGQVEGTKDRPCIILAANRQMSTGDISTFVAPITHSPPQDKAASFPMPIGVARSVNLDDGPHWVRLDELNRFHWPGFDLRPIRWRGTYVYGALPQSFFEALRTAILERQHRQPPVSRD